MRRVQSSIHGVCAGAGTTVVLQPASPSTESARFGRRRSSLVFITCPSDTPACSNSLFKLQRTASSFCSATGWDFSPVGENDVMPGGLHEAPSDNLKNGCQHGVFSPGLSTQGIENCAARDEAATATQMKTGLGNVSCFVSCPSLVLREAQMRSSCADGIPIAPTSWSPHLPLKPYNSCTTICRQPESASGVHSADRCSMDFGEEIQDQGRKVMVENEGGVTQAGVGEWLGAALASRAKSQAPLAPPSTCCRGSFGAMSTSRALLQECGHAMAGSGPQASIEIFESFDAGKGEVRQQAGSGLRRTQRVVRDLDLMSCAA